MVAYVVLIQVYNESITEAVLSLVQQTIQPQAIIVADDGSPNDSIRIETLKLGIDHSNLHYFQGIRKEKPNLDTVGITLRDCLAWYNKKNGSSCISLYDYISIIDSDSRPEKGYYEKIIKIMQTNPNIYCASGIIQTEKGKEHLISAKVIKRIDARGSGKVIRVKKFLDQIDLKYFPDITWDTWINIKAKIIGKKAIQLPEAIIYTIRPTSRLNKRDLFRDGRMTYHFGYNWLLLLYKIVTRGFTVWKGYRDAQKKRWSLNDSEVRKWFGWRFIFHFWK